MNRTILIFAMAGAVLAAGAAWLFAVRLRLRRAARLRDEREWLLLRYAESAGRDGSAAGLLREGAAAAAMVARADAAAVWFASETTGAVRCGPVYPAWEQALTGDAAAFLARRTADARIPVLEEACDGGTEDRFAVPIVPHAPAGALEPGGPWPRGAIVLRRAGARPWAEDEISAVRSLAATIGRAWGSAAAADAALVAEGTLARMIEEAPDMDFLLDETGRILRSNRRATEVTGYAAEELAGKSFMTLIAPGRGEELDDLLVEILLRGRLHRDLLALSRADGAVIDAQLEAVAVRTASGQAGGFRFALREDSGLARLIDEQAAEMEQMEQRLEAAREQAIWLEAEWAGRAEAWYAEALEREESAARLGLLWAREKQRAEERISALESRLAALPMAGPTAQADGGEDLPAPGPLVADAFDAARPAAEPLAPGPLAAERPGTDTLVDRESGRLLDVSPELARLLRTARNELIGQRLSELLQVDRSPELRAAYLALIGTGQGTLEIPAPPAGAPGAEQFRLWRVEAEPAHPGASGTLRIRWREIDTPDTPVLAGDSPRAIRRLIEKALAHVREESERRSVHLVVEGDEDASWEGETDPALADVLGALVAGALPEIPAGGAIRVRATVERAGGASRVRCEVHDDGLGLTSDELERLLASTAPGPAVLPRCREIVQRLGGTFLAESQVGAGTRVRFDLPLSRSSAQ